MTMSSPPDSGAGWNDEIHTLAVAAGSLSAAYFVLLWLVCISSHLGYAIGSIERAMVMVLAALAFLNAPLVLAVALMSALERPWSWVAVNAINALLAATLSGLAVTGEWIPYVNLGRTREGVEAHYVLFTMLITGHGLISSVAASVMRGRPSEATPSRP